MKPRAPVFIDCFVCRKDKGWIDTWHPSRTNKSTSRIEYCIVHKEKGKGKNSRRKCYITKPSHRNLLRAILEELHIPH